MGFSKTFFGITCLVFFSASNLYAQEKDRVSPYSADCLGRLHTVINKTTLVQGQAPKVEQVIVTEYSVPEQNIVIHTDHIGEDANYGTDSNGSVINFKSGYRIKFKFNVSPEKSSILTAFSKTVMGSSEATFEQILPSNKVKVLGHRSGDYHREQKDVSRLYPLTYTFENPDVMTAIENEYNQTHQSILTMTNDPNTTAELALGHGLIPEGTVSHAEITCSLLKN